MRPRAGGVPADLGAPALPCSKSHAQRALILAGLGVGAAVLEGVDEGDDVGVTAAAVEALGARIERSGATWRVAAAAAFRPGRVDCGDSATCLRMLAMAAGILGAPVELTGSERLRVRPSEELRAALAALGGSVANGWPLRVGGAAPLTSGASLRLAARTTSQVVSGAMLGLGCAVRRGAAHAGAVAIDAPFRAPSGYVRVTARLLEAFGVDVAGVPPGAVAPHERLAIRVGPARGHDPVACRVPRDASAATFVGAFAVLHGSLAPAWPTDDGHPDWGALAELEALGATPPGAPFAARGLAERPDSFPALAAVAAARPGRSELRGAPALRHKESDRVAAMAAGLRALGVGCEEHDDGLVVHGRDLRAHAPAAPIAVPAPRDHRVVMALALLGTVVPGGVAVPHADAPSKSWPGFYGWLARVARVELR
ncbi:MAG TPA: hypothetical protein VK081_00625 [Planctomycetota bacterium]|nr:hypothetical protein [Planctomycetota bacterium]